MSGETNFSREQYEESDQQKHLSWRSQVFAALLHERGDMKAISGREDDRVVWQGGGHGGVVVASLSFRKENRVNSLLIWSRFVAVKIDLWLMASNKNAFNLEFNVEIKKFNLDLRLSFNVFIFLCRLWGGFQRIRFIRKTLKLKESACRLVGWQIN